MTTTPRLTAAERKELLEEADRLTKWAEAWFWQIYRNQPNVLDVKVVLEESAARLRRIAKREAKGARP